MVGEAANLIYESTASSLTKQLRSGNIERNQVTANERFCGTTLAFAEQARFIHRTRLDDDSG